jgi:hypothetical protein
MTNNVKNSYEEKLKNAGTITTPEGDVLCVVPVVIDDVVFPGFLCDENGNFWKLEKKKVAKPKKKKNYPSVSFRRNGESKTVPCHKAVAQSWLSRPDRPSDVSASDWKKTPEKVKAMIRENNDFWQVNHINEDKNDYRPTNLEFVQGKENRGKAAEHARLAASAIQTANNVVSRDHPLQRHDKKTGRYISMQAAKTYGVII